MSRTDPAPQVLEILGPDGRGLRVTFRWDEDRYGHEVAYVDGPSVDVCLAAELARDRDPWPSSPALQQLSCHEPQPGRRPPGPRGALLVGMAGSSHWSQSVEAEAATLGFAFDIACRVPRPPLWLGSTYRMGPHVTADSAPGQPNLLLAFLLPGSQRLELIAESAVGLPPCRIEARGDSVVVAPGLQTTSFPCTIRWKYRIVLRT